MNPFTKCRTYFTGAIFLQDCILHGFRHFCLSRVFAIVFFLCMQPAVVYAQLADTPWPMFMHDIRHTGQNILGGPQQGELSWQFQTGSEIVASPVLGTDGTIYIGDVAGKFYAVNPGGALKWTFVTDGEIYAAAAVAAGDTQGVIYVGSRDGFLYSLKDLGASGTVTWKYETSQGISASPVINPQDGAVYFGSEDRGLYALDTAGNQKWMTTLDEEIWGSPVLDIQDNALYVGTIAGLFYAINAADGTEKWVYDTNNFITGSPTIDEKNGVILFGTEDGVIYALDKNNGSAAWTYPTGSAIRSAPAIDAATDADAIYVSAMDGILYALNRTTEGTKTAGSLKWKYATGDAIASSPAIDKDGNIYFGSADKNIYSIGRDGTLKWTYPAQDEVDSSPAIGTQEFLYIGSSDGNLYAIGSGTTARLASTVKLNPIIPAEITFGESLSATGQIDPPHLAQVTMTFANDTGETATEVVISTIEGTFSLPDYSPVSGGLWSVAAQWEGDGDHEGAASDPQTFTVNPAKPALTIGASSPIINIGQTVNITGMVTLTPDDETTRNKFLEEELKLFRSDPSLMYGDVIGTRTVLSGNQLHYSFDGVPLPSAGTWTVSVGFEKTESFEGTHSGEVTVTVQPIDKAVAGYAILIEGRVEGNSGIDSHNLTTNSIYKKLLAMGFKTGDIYYFNFDNTQDGVVVYDKPTKDKIVNTITGMAGSMNTAPASLYIIFVGHGDKEELFIYPDKLTSGDLANAINNLESQLNASAVSETVVVVLGANHSGSFIDDLSASDTSTAGIKRIIVTSADSEEVAYKGPLPPDETIRQGDYFVYEFFRYAAVGMSLKRCYEEAAGNIALFTKNETGNGLNGASAGNNQYFDASAQHPLLDDNGDGMGTYQKLYSTESRDGGLSANHIMGVGTPPPPPLELTQVTDITTLDADDTSPALFAKVSSVDKVDDVWTEIASPHHTLKYNKNATEQQVIKLPGFRYNSFDEAEGKYLWNDFSSGENDFNNFGDKGSYEVFYFARDKAREFTPLMESQVYRNAVNNTAPNTFTFISPANGTETTIALTFDWEDSDDSEGEAVTYTFQISENSGFDPVYYQQSGLTDSIAVADSTAGLHDGVTYYWRAVATDADGGITFIGTTSGMSYGIISSAKAIDYHVRNGTNSSVNTSSFTPKLANGYPGFVKGFIFDSDTRAKITKAAITVQGMEGSYTTTESGAYLIQLSSGEYALSADAPGYEAAIVPVRVDALNTTTQDIGLAVATQTASLTGVVMDKKDHAPLEGVTVTIREKKTDITVTTMTDSTGNYSITDMASGKYSLTAEKSGYKSYKTNTKLKAGKIKNQNIKLKKEK